MEEIMTSIFGETKMCQRERNKAVFRKHGNMPVARKFAGHTSFNPLCFIHFRRHKYLAKEFSQNELC